MGVRKARAYSRKYARPSTRRSSRKNQNYIKTVPSQKITKFHMGDFNKYKDNKFRYVLTMESKEKIQIRDLALEACRQYVVKELETNLLGQFYFEVKVYPHHIQRNHKVLTGVGADRMAIGMAHSFGTSEGRAALVPADHPIFVVAIDSEKGLGIARAALHKIKAKLPCTTRILTTENRSVAVVQ